jgi:UDP-N-acetylglucosamine--N-acetylmuramyl-(pentapeptide) pyrophosphoryl-undecaprenol N-acetylglucosamine transferase
VTVLIAGGGTGGHLYPGIAVARELLARRQDARVVFAGTAAGLEARVLPREGFELELIRSAGLKGKSWRARLRGAVLLPLGALDAWHVISRHRPSVAVGVGGYSSGPVIALAAARGIPTLLMEQNAVPGITNRMLARMVDAAAVTFEDSTVFFGAKAFLSGNPVRAEFFAPDERSAPPAPDAPPPPVRVLVFGGSQGAHAINMAMADAAPRLARAALPLAITHQTGAGDLEMVRDAYRRAGIDARVEPFLHAMDREMTSADLVVCRAGATTLAELTAAGRPSILIPLPTATDDHQRKNAEALAAAGAARVLDQRDLGGARLAEELAEEIVAMASEPAPRARMAAAARGLARPDAARLIVDRILALAAD